MSTTPAPGRPLPVPDDVSAAFWAAAADGVLALPRCAGCATLAFPPDVVCAACGAAADPGAVEPVPGGGTVRSFTVVRDSFLPGFADDLPFVLVDVELDAQPGLRLVGRLLDGPDAPLRSGDRVAVAFETPAPGVGVPAFRLDPAEATPPGPPPPGALPPGALPPDDAAARAVAGIAPPRPGFRARSQVAVVGYAQSPIVRHADAPLGAIAVETARRAVADAGLTPGDLDGFVTGSLLPSAGSHAAVDGVSIVSANWLARRLGCDPRVATGFQGYGQLPGAVMTAVEAIASGAADHVLVHRALHNPRAGRYHASDATRAEGFQQWTMPQGYFGPLATIALPYQEYLQRYGATRDAMAAVVTEARANGSRLPWSVWHDRPLTTDDYLAARIVDDPVCILDCDLPIDGVAAFVLTTAERAADLPHPPVYVSGFGFGQPAVARTPAHWPLDDIMTAGRTVTARLAATSGLDPATIDVPQLYDGFSPFVWFWLEALGFCAPGEAHAFTQGDGIRAAAGGLPILSGGGALGNGRMHGVPQMLECYLQLARRAGDRQLAAADTALACHSSPHYGGAVVYSAQPL